MKNIIRKRNKLVQISSKLTGGELKAVEFSIKLIDFILDVSCKDEEQGQKYIYINYEVLYLNKLENYFIKETI
jgi:hypothetical protein